MAAPARLASWRPGCVSPLAFRGPSPGPWLSPYRVSLLGVGCWVLGVGCWMLQGYRDEHDQAPVQLATFEYDKDSTATQTYERNMALDDEVRARFTCTACWRWYGSHRCHGVCAGVRVCLCACADVLPAGAAAHQGQLGQPAPHLPVPIPCPRHTPVPAHGGQVKSTCGTGQGAV